MHYHQQKLYSNFILPAIVTVSDHFCIYYLFSKKKIDSLDILRHICLGFDFMGQHRFNLLGDLEVFHKMFVIVLIDIDTSGINNNMKIRFNFY